MWRKLLLGCAIILSVSGFGQELPTDPQNGFVFPIGSKFTIKLYPLDSGKFDCSIIAYEPFIETIDYFETDTLFDEREKDGTLDLMFCIGTNGKTDEEREQSMKVVLIIKNRTDFALDYLSEILLDEAGEFQPTSNAGLYPGASYTEMWPYVIYQIAISDLRISKF